MTTAAKFTLGPWEWTTEYSDNGARYHALVSHRVAWPPIIGEYGEIDNPADAALIAAAPDLYEALRGLVDKLERDISFLVEIECATNERDILRDAHAALAKARGENPETTE